MLEDISYLKLATLITIAALCYKPEGRRFENRLGEFSIYLMLPDTLGPGVHSVSNRNEYQKHTTNIVSGEKSAAGA
jgi:hypothetical protein